MKFPDFCCVETACADDGAVDQTRVDAPRVEQAASRVRGVATVPQGRGACPVCGAWQDAVRVPAPLRAKLALR